MTGGGGIRAGRRLRTDADGRFGLAGGGGIRANRRLRTTADGRFDVAGVRENWAGLAGRPAVAGGLQMVAMPAIGVAHARTAQDAICVVRGRAARKKPAK